MAIVYLLYKGPVQLDTLAMVRYLHSQGIDLQPALCVERQHPEWVAALPSIEVFANSPETSRARRLEEAVGSRGSSSRESRLARSDARLEHMQSSERFVGIEACTEFFERESGVRGVLDKAMHFMETHPRYEIKN